MQRREGPSSKYWCFTINNPSTEDNNQLDFETWNNTVQKAVYNLEMGENGTLHYQGYIELKHHKTLAWMKRKLPRAHLEKRKGNQYQAILYCLKDCTITDTTRQQNLPDNLEESIQNLPEPFPVLFGFASNWEELKKLCIEKTQKKLNRNQALKEMKTMIETGSTDLDLANYHFPTYISCHRSLAAYRLLVTPPRNFKTNVFVCQGPTATGKSKWALEKFPNAYWKQRSNWWDGYTNQENVIIDEFYGWLPFDLMLRLCDRYPLQVETKGGNVNFVAKNIIITSNSLPSTWWKNAYFPSFERRVDEWHIFPVWGMHVFYLTYAEALPHFYNNQ